MADEDIDQRLAEEVGHLSTKLVTAVNKQVELEETVLSLRKQLQVLRDQNVTYSENDGKYREILPQFNQLKLDLKESNEKRTIAEAENAKLQGEVEDLTASLFDEANTMVSNASRETHNFKVKNRKLYEELEEKDIIIADLQEQLRDLKEMVIRIEDHHRAMSMSNTPKVEQQDIFDQISTITETPITAPLDRIISNTGAITSGITPLATDEDYHWQQLQTVVYSPMTTAIRFDLNNYNKDFKMFVYALMKPDFQFDLVHLKPLPFFKKIWHDELETAIPTIPALPSTSTLLNRWQKGKNFWSSMCEGRVSIEPVKGTNENFKLAYRGSMSHVAPVAIRDYCAFCGESRNDNLEHARMHYFKILESVGDEVIASYPLCNYCLIKLRNVCDLFAKLRLIKSNIFKLKPNSSFDDIPASSNSFGQFKRTTSGGVTTTKNGDVSSSPGSAPSSTETLMNSQVQEIELDKTEESKLIKLYMMILLTRLKIFWSKIGFWDNEDRISEINLDEIHYETFEYLVSKSRSSTDTAEKEGGDDPDATPAGDDSDKQSKEKVDNSGDDSRSEEFTDTQDKFEDAKEKSGEKRNSNEEQQKQDDDNDENLEEGDNTQMKRSNSKQFRKQLDNDLEHTLEMLAENIEVNSVD
ncbi:Rab guanine nucleotide exchange factor SEC2 [Spathaspora sp. JA1]|nr:Rab guanine nucleotide exchange factor SEC2 [Spathaspora sp. JA1]